MPLRRRTADNSAKDAVGKSGYKYARIKTDLSIQILEGRLRPHDRFPSIKEIILKYGVSHITASRVLEDMVKDGFVYASRGSGSFVADPSARLAPREAFHAAERLGVVFEHAAGAFMGDIIHGIDEEAYARKAQIALCLSNDSYKREAEILQRLADHGIRRMLLFMVLAYDEGAANPNVPLYMRLAEQGVCILLLACRVPGVPIPAVTYDDCNAMRSLVDFAAKRGCRKLAFVSRIDNASTTAERIRGFKDGLLENGLPCDASRILRVPIRAGETIVGDASATFAKAAKAGYADMVLCSDELVAAGVFDAMDRLGIAPESRPLVGGMGCTTNLHVLRGNPYVLLEDDPFRLGREAAAAMLSGEVSALPPDGRPYHRVIPVPLRIPKEVR